MPKLPEDIIYTIHKYLKLDENNINSSKMNAIFKCCFQDNIHLQLIFGIRNNTNTIIDKYKNKLTKMYYLIHKYSYYQKAYYLGSILPISSILIDLLCTGCDLPFAYSTYSVFTDEIFQDLKDIIKILPETLSSTYGCLRCRYYLSPLDMACNNSSIPLYVIKYMIKHGANIHYKYEYNGEKIHVLDDMRTISYNPRYDNLVSLFLEYGYNLDK